MHTLHAQTRSPAHAFQQLLVPPPTPAVRLWCLEQELLSYTRCTGHPEPAGLTRHVFNHRRLFAELGLNTRLITIIEDTSVSCSSTHVQIPLTVGRHVDGPPHRHRRPSLRDAQHLHGLPLGPSFTVTTQHGRVHALPGRIC